MKTVALIVVALPLAATWAATITVNTTADNTVAGDARCTLREAIANVNGTSDTTSGDCAAAGGVGDTISFNLSLPARITLAQGELVIAKDVTITGPTTGSLRIDGAHKRPVFRILAGTTNMSDLTIMNGYNPYSGGGIGGRGGGVEVYGGARLPRLAG